MKRFIKSILLMCITMMCILSVPSSALAANNAPGQVKGLKAGQKLWRAFAPTK